MQVTMYGFWIDETDSCSAKYSRSINGLKIYPTPVFKWAGQGFAAYSLTPEVISRSEAPL